ncbi:MAG TPA: YncE family protein [Bacteroidota bacterium]|nr:YncE family protein [Bacteroidota bacterium]
MRHSMMVLPLLAACALAGCVRDPVSALVEVPVPSSRGVYVVDQGNFGRGNASLSYYDLATFHVYNDVFTAVNGKQLGDVAQSMAIRGASGYIVVNNSAKIEVIDIGTNVNTGTIQTGAGTSPNVMAFADDSVALVTDLYSGSLIVVNVHTKRVTGSVAVGANPAGIAIAGGKAYVANSGFGSGNTVSVVSLGTLTTTRTISVADNPNGVEVTPSGKVYVVCTGAYDFTDPSKDTPARIVVIDPASDAVVDSIYIGGHAMDIAIGADGIGYIAGSAAVYRVDTRADVLTGTFRTGVYYATGVEPSSGDVYLADAGDFVGPGTVSVYAPDGELRTTFGVGIIPGAFAFKTNSEF